MPGLVYIGNIMERVKAIATTSDFLDALKFFKEKTGVDAEVVQISPKIFPTLEDVVPEGIELIPHGGVATWEIWLSTKNYAYEEKQRSQNRIEMLAPVATVPLSGILQYSPDNLPAPDICKPLSSTKKGRGRPRKELQANFLDILADKDMNLEEKSKILGIHFTTVQRRMKKLGIPSKREAI